MRAAIAIDEHHARIPASVDPPANRDPIKLDFVLVEAGIATEPALLAARIPQEIAVLGLEETTRQRLPRIMPELEFEPRDQRLKDPI